MPVIVTVFLIMALLCFLIGTINIQPPGTRQINWTSAGLALLVLAYLVRT
jgi:ABC-type uncharacterized transport system permease subunit